MRVSLAPLQPDKLFIATPMAMVSQRGASLDEHFRLGWIGIYTAEQSINQNLTINMWVNTRLVINYQDIINYQL